MAPELVRLGRMDPLARGKQKKAGRALYGRGVDIWAFGCLLYELLYGESLFAQDRTKAEEDVDEAVLAADGGNNIVFPAVTRAGGTVSAAATAFIAVRKDCRGHSCRHGTLVHTLCMPGRAAPAPRS